MNRDNGINWINGLNGMNTIFAVVTAAVALGVTVAPAGGQSAPASGSRPESAQSGGLFDSDQPLRLRLEVDLRTLLNDRDSVKATDHEASLRYQVGDAAPVSLDAKLKTRGHWRRQKRNCDFPPLQLNVPRSKVGETLFANQNKLKLVTPCLPNRKEYEEYILREFLVYKVYNLLTPLSLRVRLATTTYVDSKGRQDSLTKSTFLIEDAEQMAARNGDTLMEVHGARFDDMDSLQLGLVGVFLYMIGATDWSLRGLHNIELVREQREQRPVHYAVAYDFDFTGIVNTAYAGPDPRLRLRSARDRLYRGRCLTEEHWNAVLATFRERKAAIYALYENVPGLSSRYVQDTHGYLDEFYRVIDDPKKVSSELIRRCRQEEGI